MTEEATTRAIGTPETIPTADAEGQTKKKKLPPWLDPEREGSWKAPELEETPDDCPGLSNREKEVCRLSVFGFTAGEIAKMIDRSKRQVCRIKAKPEAKRYIEYLQKGREEAATSYSKKVQDYAQGALNYIVDTLGNATVPHEVRSKNARWVCECSGIVPKRDGKGDRQKPIFLMVLGKLQRGELSSEGPSLLGLAQ